MNEGITWRYGGLEGEDENDDYACRSRSDSPSEVNEGITWRYGGPFDEDENDDYAYRSVVLGERFDISVRGAGKTPVVHHIFIISLLVENDLTRRDRHHNTASYPCTPR